MSNELDLELPAAVLADAAEIAVLDGPEAVLIAFAPGELEVVLAWEPDPDWAPYNEVAVSVCQSSIWVHLHGHYNQLKQPQTLEEI